MPSILDLIRLGIARRIAPKGFIDLIGSGSAHGLLSGVLRGAAPPHRGTRELLTAYRQMPWLRAVTSRVATSVASTTWTLYVSQGRDGRAVRNVKLQRADAFTRRRMLAQAKQVGELREIEAHPLLDLIDNANPMMTGRTARQISQAYLDLKGEVFWVLERNGAGAPAEIWPVPPHWVTDTPSTTRPMYCVSFRGWRGEIPESEMVWLRDPDLENPYGRGAGIAEALGDELETDEYACHDAQTECLTRRGWVRGLEITPNDEVATWNEDKGQLEYQRPEAIHRYRYHGKLHHWWGRSVDALVTPNHRLWIESRVYRRPALGAPVWHFETSEQAAAKPGRVFKWRDAGRYSGKVDVIRIPGVNRVTKRKRGSRGGGRPPARGINDPLEFRAVDFARFLGYYISEGSLDRAGVQLAQSEGDVQEDMRRSLSIFPSEWVYESRREPENPQHKSNIKFFVRHLGLAEWLRSNVGEGAQNKRILPEVFEWVPEAQRELINGLLNGDGSWRNSSLGQSNRYVTRSKGLANDLQRLCVLLGYSSTVTAHNNRRKLLYHVNIRLHTGVRRIDRAANTWVHKVDYDGEVWCLTVQNGTLFTRRNGCVLLSGNSKHTKAWFYNRAVPELLIGVEQGSEEELKRAKQRWEDEHRGFFRAYRTHWHRGKLDVVQLGQSFQNMQLVELRRFERDTIVNVFGVPPEILGIVENSNRSTIDASDYLFSRWVLVPRLEFLRAEMQERLVPMFDERLILDYESPVPEDREYNLNVARAAPYAVTVDEFRAMMGLEELPDGKGKVFMVPFSLVPMSSFGGGEGPKPEPTSQPSTPASDEGSEAGEGDKVEDDTGDEGKGATRPGHRKDALPDRLVQDAVEAVSAEHLVFEANPIYKRVLEELGQQFLDDLGLEMRFDLLNPRVIDFLQRKCGLKIKGINTTTRNALRASLAEGVRAGESIPDLAKRVSEVFSQAKGWRATTIARTEVVGGSNFANWEAMRQSGVIEEKEWIATRDDRVRDEHLAMDGQIKPINEPFEAPGGERAMYPGDFGLPELDINCRCATAAVIEGKSYLDTEEKRLAYWQKYDRTIRPYERQFEAAMKRAFQKQQNAVMEVLKNYREGEE